ncbi:AprI/Inh family metalloprotease inhibitor [Xenorhabdus innexi]|uniref:Proteinase inhibitor n=1 Tax=Xenorhabdus innexi TaxID=290109 RepID=A0A1N6MT68_9GAMM|nr:AprI/Inh family metalloprotease inhibitor [Xenorhabdus innexi]PHM36655.1 proteinase inhibitor [Xenorhabdus innexi]SIP72026.1 Alkaline proteinase inhibitor (PrtA-specific inhibitor) [Xenorhabdus innexi]
MASSLNLPEPTELAGFWQVADKHQVCSIELTDVRLPEGSIWELKSDDCLTELMGNPVAGWRAAPDGITLTDATGYGLAFFSQESEQWVAYLVDGRDLVMTFKGKSK